MPQTKILMVAAEAAPFALTGDLGQVTGSLPFYLREIGADVRIIMPYYACAAAMPRIGFRNLGVLPYFSQSGARPARVKKAVYHGQDYYFIAQDSLFKRDGIYQFRAPDGNFHDFPDNLTRFSFFSRAVLESLPVIDFYPDVIHCFSWHSALLPIYLRVLYGQRPQYARIRTLLTMLNLAFQGLFPADQYPVTGLPPALFTPENLEYYGMINILKGGILFSDALNTVSERYAKEIQTEQFGCGLEGVLRLRRDVLSGIMNGVDYKLWDPENDAHTYGISFNRDNLENKLLIKKRLLESLSLDSSKPERPLLIFTSRLEAQKGVGLIELIRDQLLEMDISLCVLSTGSRHYSELFRRMVEKRPDRIAFSEDIRDASLLHRVIAGGDIILIPSEYEPSGIYQQLALRYGTVPLVHKTGGLADTIMDEKNGFVFWNYTAPDFLATIKRAVDAYGDRDRWQVLQQGCMAEDWSWSNSARKYLTIYRKLLNQGQVD